MGILYNHVALMAKAKKKGASFKSILTIGTQTLYLTEPQRKALANRYNDKIDIKGYQKNDFANEFLKDFFEADEVKSTDYSDYEQCDIVHDMNIPIDSKHHNQFDVLIDGGSIEHIFNVPTALQNYMNIVKPGGSIFIFTPANNLMGHGFYQFSPELFFRVFQPENGYAIEDVILEKYPYPGIELKGSVNCYSVVNPTEANRRVGLVSDSPVMIMVHAKKLNTTPIYENYPIQSDYSNIYKGGKNANISDSKGSLKNIANKLPKTIKNTLVGNSQLKLYSLNNKDFYTPWNPLK